MSTETVAALMGAGEYAQPLEEACIQFRIETAVEKSHFLANCYIESDGFTTLRESLNYTPERLKKVFSRKRLSAKDADRLGRIPGRPANQAELSRILYGGFLGRGMIQLTWRENYLAYSIAQYGDDRIVRNPEMLERLPDCVVSAGWYFSEHVPKHLAMSRDVGAVRGHINVARLHVKEVGEKFDEAMRLFSEMLDG